MLIPTRRQFSAGHLLPGLEHVRLSTENRDWRDRASIANVRVRLYTKRLTMQTLSDIRPRTKQLVFDLAETAGLDMADWRNSSNDTRGAKANPKYCYEWSYIEPGKCVILNLWHPNMLEEDGQIVHRGNFRIDGVFYKTVSRKTEWARRAQRLDEAIQTALSSNLAVRVILLDGIMRKREDLSPSRVSYRELDPEAWTITEYSLDSGAFELTRGTLTARYVDQFDIDQALKSSPERRHYNGSAFIRDPAVRRRVLRHAIGRCELCGQTGFRMESGSLYLETHHIVSLAEGGIDSDYNVVALCAQNHRRAHYADDRLSIKDRLLKIRAGQ